VDVHSTLGTLFVIAVVAVLAPVCLALLPGPRIPQVVLLLLGGMLIGPQGLRLGSPETVEILADVGLGFLFLLAGYEVDQRLLRSRRHRAACGPVVAGDGSAGRRDRRLAVRRGARQFHLDAVLGAFLAGMVLRRWAGRGLPALEGKLDALGYGFVIPIFFVYSGMTMDLRSMASAPLRVLLFTALMLLVHVVPAQLLYGRVLDLRERWQLALVTSTALPLLVAISEIGLRNGTMLPANAAALVGAGVLTVLVFPAVAVVLRRPPIVSDAPVP